MCGFVPCTNTSHAPQLLCILIASEHMNLSAKARHVCDCVFVHVVSTHCFFPSILPPSCMEHVVQIDNHPLQVMLASTACSLLQQAQEDEQREIQEAGLDGKDAFAELKALAGKGGHMAKGEGLPAPPKPEGNPQVGLGKLFCPGQDC